MNLAIVHGWARRTLVTACSAVTVVAALACGHGEPMRSFSSSLAGGATPMNATDVIASDADDLGQWAARHPRASSELGHWIRSNPDAARGFFAWAEENPSDGQALVAWALRHPYATLEVRVDDESRWAALRELVAAAPSAFQDLSAWCRKRPEAVRELVAHPGDLAWVGEHVYDLPMQNAQSFSQLEGF